MEGILFLAVAFLLPLRLLSLALRLHLSSSSSSAAAAMPRLSRSAAALLTIAALLTAIYAVSDTASHPASALRSEVDQLKLKISQLESILEENTNTLNRKAGVLEEDNKLIEAMEHDIQFLINEQDNVKVQVLKEEVRKINSDICTIESLANDAEERVQVLSSEVKKIEIIVSEQWIQVRQFEQAFILTKMMASKVHKINSLETSYKWPGREMALKYVQDVNFRGIFPTGSSFIRSCLSHAHKQCSFMQTMKGCCHEVSRFRKAPHHHYTPDIDLPNVFFLGGSVSRSYISRAYNQLKISMSATQRYHHKVQMFLKDTMRSNSYTGGLANELTTFCLAYLVVISPMWVAWILYSVQFGAKQ